MGALEASLASGSAIVGELFDRNVRSPESTRPDSRTRELHSSDVKVTSPDMRDEWHLIRRALAGNPEAQERLFKTHTPRLDRAVFAILRNREDAEDAVQESWCRAYAKLGSFEGRSAFSTWLTRIAINSALMLRRRKNVRVEVFFQRFSRQSFRTHLRRNSRRAAEPRGNSFGKRIECPHRRPNP